MSIQDVTFGIDGSCVVNTWDWSSDVKVKAVADACEPTNAAEVRSFLGLVNFTARFIPDLATVSAPLHQLTKNGEPFVWGRINSNHLTS